MTDKDILTIAYFFLGVAVGLVAGNCFRRKF
jgi:hypothetical protein